MFGFDNYEITRDGMVWSRIRGKWIKPSLSKDGYLQVCLTRDRKRFCKGVHRLVAETYLENPNNYKETHHINSIKHDNRVRNLEWCTREYNVKKFWESDASVVMVGRRKKENKRDITIGFSCTQAEYDRIMFIKKSTYPKMKIATYCREKLAGEIR